MKTPIKMKLQSEKETINFGNSLIKQVPKGTNLIILKGELGTGKTTLVKGIAKGLGIKEEITSPTYGYKRTYKGLSHYDLYLTSKMNSKELQSLISEDLDEGKVVIEWGEKLPKIKNSIIILLKYSENNTRTIEVRKV